MYNNQPQQQLQPEPQLATRYRRLSVNHRSSREHGQLHQPRRLGVAHDEVEVLQRLARRALDEVVDDADHDGAPGDAVGEDVDEAEVAVFEFKF